MFSKLFSTATFMALLTSVSANTFLVTSYAGMKVAGAEGCAGTLISTVTGHNEAVTWSDCVSFDSAATCMNLIDIGGDESICEVRTYYGRDCEGPFGFFKAGPGQSNMHNVEATYSIEVLCTTY